MDNILHVMEGESESLFIAHVTEEKPNLGVAEDRIRLLHLPLLPFIARENDDPADGCLFEKEFGTCLAERSCAASDENGFFLKKKTHGARLCAVHVSDR